MKAEPPRRPFPGTAGFGVATVARLSPRWTGAATGCGVGSGRDVLPAALRALGCAGVLLASCPAEQVAGAPQAPRIALLAAESSVEQMGPHNRGALDVATALSAALLLRQADGSFADSSGEAADLRAFDVVWHHQGDAIQRTGLYSGKSLAELRRFAGQGGGVLLSGGALAMVAQLGLEQEIRPQRHDHDQHREPAGMVPVEPRHAAFAGLAADADGTCWLSNGGCRAVADFDWGGPAEAMVLARTPAGNENPLAEYRLGEGRVIVFGWHWPDFADRANPHRRNLLQLTGNLLRYLGDPGSWQAVRIRSDYPPLAEPDTPGISGQRWRALRMAIEDLRASFPERYQAGAGYLRQLDQLRAEHDRSDRNADFAAIIGRFEALQRESLLANPLLDFDRLLVIRRSAGQLGLPHNSHGNPNLPPAGYDNSLIAISPARPGTPAETVYQPEADRFVGDLDLHSGAGHLLFSMPDERGLWRVHELSLRSGAARALNLIDEPDVHNYDACYLSEATGQDDPRTAGADAGAAGHSRIAFTSTAPFTGVPCLGGKSMVANLYLRDHDGSIRRLTVDQDHNWCPTPMNDGRILYQRWEYADIDHAFTRLLFHAYPDGSGQAEHYGSNSFWPTTMFFARPIPDHPSAFVAVVGGHHDAPRQGELVLFDPALGRREAGGVVQRIPGHGRPVIPKVLDGLVGTSWPRFLHPYPLSDKYFIVSCKPAHDSLWGVYLVDVFDNFVLLHEESGRAMFEPIPLRRRAAPPPVPDRVDPAAKSATVLLTDVYHGPGTGGVPRGSIKSLRLISYEFTFHGIGCEPDRVGFDGPWDVKRIIGTVPVEPDGSALFTVPASTPIAIQPLDAGGKAVALMRSWFTAGPGETLSCAGCHEPQNTAPPFHLNPSAARRPASPIKPWYGPARGFSFVREVQPVLDHHCVGCHDGSSSNDAGAGLDLTARPPERVASAFNMRFTPSYTALRRFVHVPTLESDAHLLPAYAFHADTSKLVQILRDGHHGVRLGPEAWDRIITWIDLNAPAHGSWMEVAGEDAAKIAAVRNGALRRRELHRRYTGIDEDQEAVFPGSFAAGPPAPAGPAREAAAARPAEGWVPPPAAPHATTPVNRTLIIAPGVDLEMARIPAGEFVMGSERGFPNEEPVRRITIDQAFWIGRREVTNRQYACYDPHHDSGLETGEQYGFGEYERGHRLNRPGQPVVRVSAEQASGFCRWLSQRTGLRVRLPCEAEWEYACRAGTRSALWYGDTDADFSGAANLSDATHHTVDYPHVPTALPPWRPADCRYDDHWRVSAPVGTFRANPWGLFDMHGNVAEWTDSAYRDPAESVSQELIHQVVRGGSWMDRPRRARSAFRAHYGASQPMHDVGFRVVCVDRPDTADGG